IRERHGRRHLLGQAALAPGRGPAPVPGVPGPLTAPAPAPATAADPGERRRLAVALTGAGAPRSTPPATRNADGFGVESGQGHQEPYEKVLMPLLPFRARADCVQSADSSVSCERPRGGAGAVATLAEHVRVDRVFDEVDRAVAHHHVEPGGVG